jgi:cell division protein FtsB
MKKLVVLFCLLLLVLPLVLTGCGGVAEADYEAVVAERDALQAENNALQADIDALQADIDELETELDATQSDVTALIAELDKKLAAVIVMKDYFADALSYIAGGMSDTEATETLAAFVAGFGGLLDPVGSEEIAQLWDDVQAAAAVNDLEGLVDNVTAIMNVLEDLIADDMAAIEASLS